MIVMIMITMEWLENLFGEVDKKDYYKPILVKSSFKCSYKYYESRGDRKKVYQ